MYLYAYYYFCVNLIRMLAKGYFYRALKVEMKPKKDSAEDAQQDPAGGRKRKKGKKDEELKGKKAKDVGAMSSTRGQLKILIFCR